MPGAGIAPDLAEVRMSRPSRPEVGAVVQRLQKRVGTLLVLVIALALGLLGGTAFAAPYTIIDLATLDEGATAVVRGVNGGGTAVGAGRLSGVRRGLLFRSTGLQTLDGFAGSDYTVAFGINDLGAVVGGSNGASAVRAFLRTPDGASRELEPLPGDTASTAFGVNNRHQAVGVSSGALGERAVLWAPDGTVGALSGMPGAATRARAVNDRGDVVGVADAGAGPRAVAWPGGGPALSIGALPGRARSEALAVNARGTIVGYSADASGARRATLWPAGGAPVDMGALAGGSTSQALGLNDAGFVVGTSSSSAGDRACLWTPGGGPQDLNALVAPFDAVLTHATGINQAGVIVAFGHDVVAHAADDGHEGGHDDSHELPVRVFLLVPSGARP